MCGRRCDVAAEAEEVDMSEQKKKHNPVIEVTLYKINSRPNPVMIKVSVWLNGSRKSVWGEGATIDEAWDWAKNTLEARYDANRDVLDAIMPLYEARFPTR